MIVRTLHKGDVVFKEGSKGECLYRIIDGGAAVYVSFNGTDDAAASGAENAAGAGVDSTVGAKAGGAAGAGKNAASGLERDGQKLLTVLKSGAVFGEMSLLEGWPRSATVVITEDETRLVEINRLELNQFFLEDPYQIRLLMENLSHRLRALTEDYSEACRVIRQMQETRPGASGRTKDFFAKLGRFLGIYKKTKAYEGALGANEVQLPSCEAHKQRVNGKYFGRGEVIFRQGDEGNCMYCVEEGSVGIFTDYGTDHVKQLVVLQEGKFFGEMGMVEQLPRSATAVAMEDNTRLSVITERDMEMLFMIDPDMLLRCLRHMSSRVRIMTDEYLNACRTLAHMKEAEENQAELSAQEKEEIKRYINIAMAQTPLYCNMSYQTYLC